MSAPLPTAAYTLLHLRESTDHREAQERAFAILHDVAPQAKDDRAFRLVFATVVMGRPVKSMALSRMTLATFDELADRLFALKRSPDTIESLIAETLATLPAPKMRPDPERLAAIGGDFDYSAEIRKRHNWADADRLAELCDLCRAQGETPHERFAEMARRLGLTVAEATRWLTTARLVPPLTRLEFPDLSWDCFVIAAAIYWPKGHTPTPAEVRERLVLASDSQWTAVGLTAHLAPGKTPTDDADVDDVAFQVLTEGFTESAKAKMRGRLAYLKSVMVMRLRKVAA